MRYEVLTFGSPVLRQKAVPVADISADIRRLADDMLETMYAYKGLGLAAEQVGKTWSICVLDVPPQYQPGAGDEIPLADVRLTMPLVMVNPEIIAKSGSIRQDEGCLSFPEIYAPVERPSEVTVAYLDLKGNRRVLKARHLLARAILHEFDHLSGVLLVDRMSVARRVSLSGRLKRLKAKTGQAAGRGE